MDCIEEVVDSLCAEGIVVADTADAEVAETADEGSND